MPTQSLASLQAARLQWVRGPVTAVMGDSVAEVPAWVELQWVRGPVTAVMSVPRLARVAQVAASMGPRSGNRGYVVQRPLGYGRDLASMGPRSGNRGYDGPALVRRRGQEELQWVRGP